MTRSEMTEHSDQAQTEPDKDASSQKEAIPVISQITEETTITANTVKTNALQSPAEKIEPANPLEEAASDTEHEEHSVSSNVLPAAITESEGETPRSEDEKSASSDIILADTSEIEEKQPEHSDTSATTDAHTVSDSTQTATNEPEILAVKAEEQAGSDRAAPKKNLIGLPFLKKKFKALKVGRKKKSSLLTTVVLITLLASILLPAIGAIITGIQAYALYGHAQQAMQHLLKVKGVFTGAQEHPTGFLDVGKLNQAQGEIVAAQNEFKMLDRSLGDSASVSFATRFFPDQVSSASQLCKIGLDVTDIGQKLIQTAQTLAPSFRGSLLADSNKPLVTQSMLDLVGRTIDYLLPRLNDIQARSHAVKLNSLPISAQQKQQLTQLLQLIPVAQNDLAEGRSLLGAVGWLLGVNEPRTLLVQTMDRAELRPTGGFTGQFGDLAIKGGRISPFTLKNIGPFEEGETILPVVHGASAPAPYDKWWPIPNWGLRDANMSADFPTSAKIAIEAYKNEFHQQVDGVVLFSPFLISRILQITGPISIPEYQETITAQNLEERLHFYQLDNAGIRKEEIVEHVPDSPDAPTQARKLFTARLSRLLMDHVRHAPPDELITIASDLLYDLKTKDLQIYVTNPQIQSLLSRYGLAGEINRSDTHDGFYVVQANLSASKASQYVHTTLQDTVNLDSKGGATHTLNMRLVYNQIGSVYGLDTYRDYIRVYVPESAQLRWGNGFDSGEPLCGGNFRACPPYDVYGDGTLLCPRGLTDAGYATDMLHDPFFRQPHPITQVGGPTNLQSDEPGRKMFGGWAVIPKNCSLTLTLSWYVPPMGPGPYSLLIQRQSSTLPEIDLTILPPPMACSQIGNAGLHYQGILDGPDMSFTLSKSPTVAAGKSCYPQTGT